MVMKVQSSNFKVQFQTPIYIYTSSYGDESSKALFFDTLLMFLGYGVMFLYTMLVLGKINLVEHRCYLAMAGIAAVGMGMIISMGLTMAFGFFFTTIHGVLPFLALGKRKRLTPSPSLPLSLCLSLLLLLSFSHSLHISVSLSHCLSVSLASGVVKRCCPQRTM
jgi:hypothetical protein